MSVPARAPAQNWLALRADPPRRGRMLTGREGRVRTLRGSSIGAGAARRQLQPPVATYARYWLRSDLAATARRRTRGRSFRPRADCQIGNRTAAPSREF